MGFFDGYDIATSGMHAQRSRINVVSANIANAQTTHTKDGGPYRKQNVIFEEILLDKQKNTNPRMSNNFFGSNSLSGKNINFSMTNARHINLANTNLRHIGIDNLNTTQDGLSAVNVKKIQTANLEPMMKYEPGHPEANKDGYVAYPNVNPVIEMVDLIEAMRSYEANVAVFQTQKTMDTKTLNILKG